MDEKPLYWMGSSKKDFLGFPADVVHDLGFALHLVQFGWVPGRPGTIPSGDAWLQHWRITR